ncbi:unnamed protein product [Caenorhabditis angaria]|uniref:NR LBD domain-containing protein n=1 Tax=Caenorhabditis angaria TaxID=860376 RepID=A0A9P1N8M4_9PELO|nr:unnamed protein product [Caenorhabditis angaria]
MVLKWILVKILALRQVISELFRFKESLMIWLFMMDELDFIFEKHVFLLTRIVTTFKIEHLDKDDNMME